MKLWIAALLGAGLLAAQQQEGAAGYLGQTWVGLLVSGSCQAQSKQNTATNEANRTVTDRVTTPAVDTAGTRGASERDASEPAARGNVPQTGDVSVRDKGKIRDPGWKRARQQASSLNAACRVDASTREFSLLLPDGSVMRFDDVANGKIREQFRSRGSSGAAKILRVQVVGKRENGRLAVDQIQM